MMSSMLMDNNEGTHKIFFDDESDVLKFNPVEYFETDEKLLKNKTNRIKKSQLDKVKVILINSSFRPTRMK
jgi:hypothetical protein